MSSEATDQDGAAQAQAGFFQNRSIRGTFYSNQSPVLRQSLSGLSSAFGESCPAYKYSSNKTDGQSRLKILKCAEENIRRAVGSAFA